MLGSAIAFLKVAPMVSGCYRALGLGLDLPDRWVRCLLGACVEWYHGWEVRPGFNSCCVSSLPRDLTQFWLRFPKILSKETERPCGL